MARSLTFYSYLLQFMTQTQKNIDVSDKNGTTSAPRIKRRKEMKALAKEFAGVSWGKKQSDFPDYGKPLMQLVNELKSGNDSLKKELSSVKKAFQSQNKAPARPLMDASFFNKAGFYPTKANLIYLGSVTGTYVNGAWAPGFNATKMMELVLLDDIPQWLKSGLAQAAKFGATALNTAYPSFAPVTNLATTFTDQWANSGVYNAPVSTQMEIYKSSAPTIEKNNNIQKVVNYQHDLEFYPDAVDVASLSYVILPERRVGIARFDDVLPGAIYKQYYEIPVVPGTTGGNYFCVINCSGVQWGTSNLIGAFITYTTSTNTYDPPSGNFSVLAGSYVAMNNPLTAQSSGGNLVSARVVGVSAEYNTLVKTNTTYANGQVEAYHDPSYEYPLGGGLSTGNPVVQSGNIGAKPFFVRATVTDKVSMTYYNPLDSKPYIASGGGYNSLLAPIVFQVSGANTAGYQVGIIGVSVTWNVIPTAQGLASLPIQNPGVGPFTADIMDTIYQKSPQIFMSDVQDRAALVKVLENTEPRYTSLMKAIMQFDFKHTIRTDRFGSGY